jgi:hypothetical protein
MSVTETVALHTLVPWAVQYYYGKVLGTKASTIAVFTLGEVYDKCKDNFSVNEKN